MTQDDNNLFFLSKEKLIKGNRRLLREKVLQILNAYEISEIPWTKTFSHVFFREFNFGEGETFESKLLTPDEVLEIESDIPIAWEEEDIEFAKQIIEKVIGNKEYLNSLISANAANWEIDRIALIDRLLIKIAITEVLEFPEIPLKVSINEALELTKYFSTDKSNKFVNGLLDSIVTQLNKEGAIKKHGRGLINKNLKQSNAEEL